METSQNDGAVLILRKLGLSKSAARCYMYIESKLPASQSTGHVLTAVSVRPSSLYRALNELQQKGFIVSSPSLIKGKVHRAIPLSQALDNYALHQREVALPLIQQLRDR